MARSNSYVRKKFKPLLAELPKEPDWPSVMMGMVRLGVPKAHVAQQCNLTREKLYSILSGKYKPNWMEGQRILALSRMASLLRNPDHQNASVSV